eukprot:TRINITY_DN10334_c0_g2_i1.p1 TRINITY_DN10334_c0_g2~~TRINITY_DN10334_c0_g2_i1.p1  ORF type:complete len:183 (+),score=55.62 TRINITY_DN10334_c0_g2_i1:877-1425(+)
MPALAKALAGERVGFVELLARLHPTLTLLEEQPAARRLNALLTELLRHAPDRIGSHPHGGTYRVLLEQLLPSIAACVGPLSDDRRDDEMEIWAQQLTTVLLLDFFGRVPPMQFARLLASSAGTDFEPVEQKAKLFLQLLKLRRCPLPADVDVDLLDVGIQTVCEHNVLPASAVHIVRRARGG